MPWNGTGLFIRKHNWTNEAASNTPILAANFDDDTNDIVTAGLGNCITRDGQGGPTADQNWNNVRLYNLKDPVLAQDAVTLNYVNSHFISSGGSTALSANLNAGGFQINNLGTPTNPADAVTKQYVDNLTGQPGSFVMAMAALTWLNQ